ncbi:MAG: glycoside hydrolase family 2 TIM barrel-domain containing protein [Opitutaceae bacterium]
MSPPYRVAFSRRLRVGLAGCLTPRGLGHLALSAVAAIAVAGAPCASAASPAGPRVTRPLDNGWKFTRGDPPGAQAPSFDTSGWKEVNVPHDWSIAGPFSPNNPTGGAGGFLPAGIGWYRRTFTLPPEDAGHRVLIEFGAVMANSEVWINGYNLGHHPYGYSSFAYDLTGHLNPTDRPNVLAVRVDDAPQPASRWYSGAGICRPVHLLVESLVHLQLWSTFVTTPTLSADSAMVRIQAAVVNGAPDARAVRLEVLIFDPHGRLAARAHSSARVVPAGKSAEFTLEVPVSRPDLWDVDHPALYRAETMALEAAPDHRSAEAVADDVTTPFGIREARFKAATGFWLNGRTLKLKGVCIHSEGSAFGAAVPLAVWRRRLAALKGLGVNAIRTAHNPPAAGFLDLCDRMGFLVMDEAFDCWTVGKNPYDYHLYFRQWWKRDLIAMVRRDRNHPCIVLWSAGNEIHDTPNAPLAKHILAAMVRVFHENDPTRPVTQALLRPNRSHDYADGLADLLDVIGTNYRYNELLAAHAVRPSRKIIGTEDSHDRAAWLAVRDHSAYSGEFIWSGIDYLGESHFWPNIAAGSGLIDRTGYPHSDGYKFESWWSATPMVYVARQTRRAFSLPQPKHPSELPPWMRHTLEADWNPGNPAPHEEEIVVYSNCESVELFLNGRSLGAQTRATDLAPRTWKVAYVPGTLRAVGRDGGREVAETALVTAGAPAAIRLTSDHSRLAPGFDHAATITAEVVDAAGERVPQASNEISFHARGPGKVVAVDSADNASHEPFQAARRRAFEGRCIALVRATADAGPITVTATAPGLRSAQVKIEALP